MAVQNKGFSFQLVGSIGDMTGVSKKGGGTYYRARVRKINDKNSPAQQAQRTHLKNIVALFQRFKQGLKGGYAYKKGTHSPYNAFVRLNSKVLAYGFNPDSQAVWDSLILESPGIPQEGTTTFQQITDTNAGGSYLKVDYVPTDTTVTKEGMLHTVRVFDGNESKGAVVVVEQSNDGPFTFYVHLNPRGILNPIYPARTGRNPRTGEELSKSESLIVPITSTTLPSGALVV